MKGIYPVVGGAAILVSISVSAQQLDQVPEPEGPHVRSGFEELYARQGVSEDDWRSEEISAQIQDRLKKWSAALAASPPDLKVLLEDCTACEVAPLAPSTTAIPHVTSLEIRRADKNELNKASFSRGPDALREQLTTLLAHLPESNRRMAFKVYRVDPEDSRAAVTVHYSAFGENDRGATEHHATWLMTWSLGPPLQLERLQVVAHEETDRDGGPLLADCTGAVLGSNSSWADQLALPLHHWWRSLDRMSGVTFRGYQGLAIGDVDGDGLDDLFVAQPGGLPDRLYLQQADGSALDVSRDAAVDYLELTRSALIVDLDNDGDQDLATVRSAHVVVLVNNGEAVFRPAAILPLEGAVMVSAADYDGDGDLDLYGVGYRNPDEGLPPTPYHDAINGQRNHLYRNDGDLRFTDVTDEVGMGEKNRRFSFSAVWEDYDNDGDPDLYVANDFGRNNLFRNVGGSFEDVAATAGVEDISAGMGASWADFDLDGWMDLYVSNMFSSAGGRVTYQRRFRPGEASGTLDLYRRHARGNSLFHNQGDGGFVDISEEARVTMARWAWGGIFSDLDNDGYPDIVVPNGFLTNENSDDL